VKWRIIVRQRRSDVLTVLGNNDWITLTSGFSIAKNLDATRNSRHDGLRIAEVAFPIRPHYDEIDYLVNYVVPHPAIVATLAHHEDALEMCRYHLPSSLDDVS
jgi:hypothetical protein